MGRKMTGGPSLFDSLLDPAPAEPSGAYPRVLSAREAAAAYEAAVPVPLPAGRIQEIVDYATGADRFQELAAVVLRARDLISERKFASAEAHLRTIIERLNLKEGANA